MDSIPAHECQHKGLLMATRTALSVARTSSFSKKSKQNRPAARRARLSPASHVAASRSTASPSEAPRLRLFAARTGDQPLIHELLVSVFHGPSLSEFQAQLDEPGYAAADRLIVKDGEEIAAHLRLAKQTIHVDSEALSAARFMDLATAPEFRERGLATALIAAGERAAAERGSLVGLTRTRVPALFAQHGWSICGRHTFSEASPRSVLAELAVDVAATAAEGQSSPLSKHLPETIIVRPLRRIELRAIVRLYEQHLSGKSGWPTRSEEYWEWLLARGACDHVYVASNSADTSDFEHITNSIIGYACVRQSRIVELVAGSRNDVARQLIERVCADTREQDGWTVRYDAPANDSLHDVFRRAGGRVTINQEVGGEFFMAKLLDPLQALRRLVSLLAARARAAKAPLPLELGIELRSGGGRKAPASSGVLERFRLLLDKRSARVETGGPSKHCLVLAYSDLAPLLLGDVGAESMIQSNRARATTPRAKQLAVIMFPGESYYRPPLDDLLA
jgi:predicted acetyltransferase